MNIEELFKSRRSIRSFQEKEVSLEMLNEILEETVLAPSAGNEQPWKFIIVKNKELINDISEECKKNIIHRIDLNPNDYAKKYEKMLKSETFNIFYKAPAVIFILGDSKLKNLIADCSLAASYLMMSAVSKGLGTCWINFGASIEDKEIIQKMEIPTNYSIVAPIAIGYPKLVPNIPKRNSPQIIKIIE